MKKAEAASKEKEAASKKEAAPFSAVLGVESNAEMALLFVYSKCSLITFVSSWIPKQTASSPSADVPGRLEAELLKQLAEAQKQKDASPVPYASRASEASTRASTWCTDAAVEALVEPGQVERGCIRRLAFGGRMERAGAGNSTAGLCLSGSLLSFCKPGSLCHRICWDWLQRAVEDLIETRRFWISMLEESNVG